MMVLGEELVGHALFIDSLSGQDMTEPAANHLLHGHIGVQAKATDIV
jgi:hypothetical protein